jgi:hypothetical protein
MTRRILLSSGSDQPYYPQMRKYMESVQRCNTVAETYLVGVGWQPPDAFGFKGLHLPIEQAVGHGGTWCVQHGAFLKVLPADDNDIVIFTDGGDVVMQRDFSPAELRRMEALDERTVMAVWNAGPTDSLTKEAPRLVPKPDAVIPERFKSELPVYNTGVVVATAGAYRRLYDVYMQHWDEVAPLFRHYAKQQWLMSWVLGMEPSLRVSVLPYSFHLHGFYGLPVGARLINNVLYYERETVLFRHRVGQA